GDDRRWSAGHYETRERRSHRQQLDGSHAASEARSRADVATGAGLEPRTVRDAIPERRRNRLIAVARAGGTHTAQQPLRYHSLERRSGFRGIDAKVAEPRDGARGVDGVKGREDEVSRQCGLDRYRRSFGVADLSD